MAKISLDYIKNLQLPDNNQVQTPQPTNNNEKISLDYIKNLSEPSKANNGADNKKSAPNFDMRNQEVNMGNSRNKSTSIPALQKKGHVEDGKINFLTEQTRTKMRDEYNEKVGEYNKQSNNERLMKNAETYLGHAKPEELGDARARFINVMQKQGFTEKEAKQGADSYLAYKGSESARENLAKQSNREQELSQRKDYNALEKDLDEYINFNPNRTIDRGKLVANASAKYGISEEQFKDYALTRQKQLMNEKNAQKSNKAKEYAEAHPVLGSIASFGNTVQQGAQAIPNIVTGAITGDDRFINHNASQMKTAYREGAKENINSNVGKMLYDLGMGGADLGVAALESGLTGGAVNPALLMALNSADEAQRSALERGADTRSGSLGALAQGGVSYLMNKKGLDFIKENLSTKAITGAKDILKNAGAGALAESLENVTEDSLNAVVDNLFNGNNAELQSTFLNYINNGMDSSSALVQTAKEFGGQLLQSAGSGALFGGAFAGVGSAKQIPSLFNNRLSNQITNGFANGLDDGAKVTNADVNNDIAKAQSQVNEVTNITDGLQEQLLESARQQTDALDNRVDNARVLTNEEVNNLKQGMSQPDEDTFTNHGVKTNDMNVIRDQIDNGDYDTARANLEPRVEDYTSNNVNNQLDVEPTREMPYEVGDTTNNSDVVAEIESGEFKDSKVIDNTATNNKLYRGIDNDTIDTIKAYEEHTENKTFGAASERAGTDEGTDTWSKKYIDGTETIETDVDVDTAMIALHNLANRYDEARANGDTTKATMLNVQRAQLLDKLRRAGTKAGQEIQAFAKWNRTSLGAEVNAERILTERTDSFMSKHSKLNEQAKNLSNKLLYAFKRLVEPEVAKVEKPKPTVDEILEEVNNTLSYLSKEKDYSDFTKKFNEDDARYIANLISNGATKDELTDLIKRKVSTGTFGLSEATQSEVNKLFEEASKFNVNSKEFVDRETEAYRLIANEVCGNASLFDKFNAWRFMAMLGNPKTMIRNYIGNKVFGGVTGVSNNLSAIIEAGIDKITGGKIDRTKAVLNPVKDADLIKATTNDADNTRYRQLQGDKYRDSISKDIKANRDVWKSKGMRAYENWIGEGTFQYGDKKLTVRGKDVKVGGLSDYKATRKKYGTSLAGFLKANGVDASIFEREAKFNELDAKIKKFEHEGKNRLFTKDEMALIAERNKYNDDMKLLKKARDFAQKQAEYAVFHEDNAVATALNKLSNATPLTHVLVEGLVPFKKTPANILRSGIEYSPLGIIDSVVKTGKMVLDMDKEDIYKGTNIFGQKVDKTKVKAADVIDSWSKTLSGTGMAVLGAYLLDKGILHTSNDDEYYQDQLEGIQNYSLEYSMNGKDYTATIDFLAPAVMPLLMGAEMKKVYDASALPEEGFWNNISNLSADDMMNSMTSIIAPVMETSMLSGVEDTLNELANAKMQNNNANPLGTLLWNLGTGYATQAVPTILGQGARTIDNTRRSTYTEKQGVGRTVDKQIQKMQNKIPVLSMQNEAYIDSRGNTQENVKNGNLVKNAAYQFLSPTYIQQVDTRAEDKLVRDVYNVTKDENIFAEYDRNKRIDGEKLMPEDMSVYSEATGKANTTIRNRLANNEAFTSLQPETQADIFKKVNSLADKIGESKVNADFVTSDDYYREYKTNGLESVADMIVNDAKIMDLGANANDTTRELYKNDGAKGIEAYNAVTDYVYTKDADGKDKKLSWSKDAYEYYKKGKLDEYAEACKKLEEIGLNKKNTMTMVQQDNVSFAMNHNENDLRILKKIEDAGNQEQWTKRLKAMNLSTDLAYDIIMTMRKGELKKELVGKPKAEVVKGYYNYAEKGKW